MVTKYRVGVLDVSWCCFMSLLPALSFCFFFLRKSPLFPPLLASLFFKAAFVAHRMLLHRKRPPPSAMLQVSVLSVVLRSSMAAVVFDLCVSLTRLGAAMCGTKRAVHYVEGGDPL
jgi:hypothetical protein